MRTSARYVALPCVRETFIAETTRQRDDLVRGRRLNRGDDRRFDRIDQRSSRLVVRA